MIVSPLLHRTTVIIWAVIAALETAFAVALYDPINPCHLDDNNHQHVRQAQN
jgi:hypothetical protein